MPPTVHEVQATTGRSANVAVTAPATVQAGDLLLAHVAFDGYNSPAITSVPAGWTLIEAQADGTTVYGGWWWKRAESGDASASWVFIGNGNSEEWIAHCVRVTGHHPTTPINAHDWATGSSSGPYISPAVVTDVDDCLIIYSLARDGGDHSHTPPPGCVEIFDGVSAASGATAAAKVQSTAGDTGSGEFGSATVEQWLAITIAIAPEPSDDTLLPLPLTVGAPVLGAPNLSGPGMTPVPVFETDVEETAPLSKWAFVRNVTVTTAQAVSPTHSLLFAPTGASAYVRQVMPGVSDKVVVRFHLRFDSLPTVNEYVWWYGTGVSKTVGIHYDAESGHLEAQLEPGDDYISVGPVISAGQWYEIIIKVDISGTTHTIEWMVDGVAYATIARPGSTPDTFDSTNGMRLGTQAAGDANFYIDDVAVYNDPAAYPGQAADLNAADVLLGAPALTSPALSQAHALAGDGVAAPPPSLAVTALTQTHELPAGDVATAAAVLSAPGVSQTHELVGDGVTAGPPELGTPSLGSAVTLTAEAVALGAPVLASPALTQTHELTASGLTAAAASVLSAPSVSQTHALVGNGVTAGPPELAAAAVEQTHVLTAAGHTSGTPVLESPSLGGTAMLIAEAVALGAPVLPSPGLAQIHELTAASVALSAPMLSAPGVSQTHELGADGVLPGSPVLGAPSLGSVAALTVNNLVLGAPVVETTVLTQTHELVGDDVATGPPELGAADISQVHALGTGSLMLSTPLPGNPVLDQVHVLVATPLTTAPEPGRPPLVQTHELVAADIVAGVPVPGWSRFRVVTAVLFSARMPGTTASARAPRLTDVAARQLERTFDMEEEI